MKVMSFGRVVFLAASVSLGLVGCATTPATPQDDQGLNDSSTSKAAEQETTEYQYLMGVAYNLGEGMPQNDKQAVVWYLKAAEQGHAQAQGMLGFAYKFGRGVPQSDKKAAEWIRKAAEQGVALAQFELGAMHFSGRGVSKDDNQGVVWFRKAAEQGEIDAQGMLGFAYKSGRGVPQDYKQAADWFLNRPYFPRHLKSLKLRSFRRCYEQAATLHGRI